MNAWWIFVSVWFDNFCKEPNENGEMIFSSSDDVEEKDEFTELSVDCFRGRREGSASYKKKKFIFCFSLESIIHIRFVFWIFDGSGLRSIWNWSPSWILYLNNEV
jgi:hypothetical protein